MRPKNWLWDGKNQLKIALKIIRKEKTLIVRLKKLNQNISKDHQSSV